MQKVIKRMTERDLEILRDLYRFRVMNRSQIERIYFQGNRWYTYRKMYIMRNSGYVQSKIIMKSGPGGRQKTAVYHITDRGIRLLKERGEIEEEFEAKDLQIDRYSIDSYLDFNDLYVELRGEGYKFLDSRMLKKKYQMERSGLCKGAIVAEDGKEYLVYIVRGEARESTLRRVLKEIRRKYKGMGKRHNLVLFRGLTSYDSFRMLYKQSERVLDSVYALPYTYALNLFKAIKGEMDFVKLITKYGQTRSNPDYPRYAPEEYKRHLIHHKGEEKYAVNLLMNDLTLIDRIRRERLDKKVVLFSFEMFADELREDLKDVRGIEVIEITDRELGIC